VRKLKTSDIFAVMRLIKKANLKEEIRPVVALAASDEFNVTDLGIEGILTVVEIFTEKKSEKAIYEFLSGPFETSVDDVENMGLNELAENLKVLAEDNDLKTFFTILQGMIITKS